MVRHRENRLAIYKFGGAALADAAGMRRAAELVIQRGDAPTVVVTSALSGVTDALIAIELHATTGEVETMRDEIARLRDRHREIAHELWPTEPASEAMDPGIDTLGEIDAAFAELESICAGISRDRMVTPAVTDLILARGERLAARLFAGALTAVGGDATVVDATRVIMTQGQPSNASPDIGRTKVCANAVITPLLRRGVTVVVPGFIGAAHGDHDTSTPVTLGRGGSDLSATLLARALEAREVVLWKDVPGILTADPAAVPDARVVAELHVREAAELAYYGAKVLHPRALIPVTSDIRVRVRPYSSPGAAGTEISMHRGRSRPPVRALSAIAGQALITISGNGMLGVPGIAARTFGALAAARISVSLISQASSEHSICLTVPEKDAIVARERLLDAFAPEIALEDIEGVDVRTGLATIAVVGMGMAHAPGIAGRLFGALGDAGINVVAIAQGSSELNISFMVDGARAAEAQRVIHAAFNLEKQGGGRPVRHRHRDVILLGFGRIGRELARHIAQSGDARQRLRIVAVIDRSGYLFDRRGIPLQRVRALAALKEKSRGSVADAPGAVRSSPIDALRNIASHALVRPVLADLAAGDTREVVLTAVQLGMDVVMANKFPLASDRSSAQSIIEGARARGRRVLHEATVGAGLPIIDTVRKLQEAGDRIMSIEGCPSGTLGFLFGELGRGRRFSQAVRDAMAAGYTEPDPRDDLSGLDVARKALILGRLLGFRGELDDVAIESLVPEALRHISLDEFLARIGEADAIWEARAAIARERGEVLRYRARASSRQVSVRLVSVKTSSPLASLHGTDNQFVFTTARYLSNPLIITGPGAGAAVTAGGVLNDLMLLA